MRDLLTPSLRHTRGIAPDDERDDEPTSAQAHEGPRRHDGLRWLKRSGGPAQKLWWRRPGDLKKEFTVNCQWEGTFKSVAVMLCDVNFCDNVIHDSHEWFSALTVSEDLGDRCPAQHPRSRRKNLKAQNNFKSNQLMKCNWTVNDNFNFSDEKNKIHWL